MLKKNYRLRKKYQFNYVYKVGKTQRQPDLILFYCPSKNKNIKIGLSVNKKVGGAVTRNRIKRQLRESLLPVLDLLKPNFNIIIFAQPSINGKPFGDIKFQVTTALTKAEIL